MAIELTITLNETGQVHVTGPIADKGVCYMLLELAKDAIRDHCLAQQRLVQPAVPIAGHFGPINGGRHG